MGVVGLSRLDHLKQNISSDGPERLARKLSVDINDLIPQFVKEESTRKAMMSTAEKIADEHGLRKLSLRQLDPALSTLTERNNNDEQNATLWDLYIQWYPKTLPE